MNLINFDLPRHVLLVNVSIAGLGGVGFTFLTGGPWVGIPLITLIFTAALVLVPRIQVAGADTPADVTAMRDPDTALATEEIARDTLTREFAAAQRGRPLTLVLLRVEGLTSYGARHGKAVADQLLRVTGRTMSGHLRDMHVASRHSHRPGTFLSILSGCDAEGASVYAARLRRDLMTVKGLPVPEGVSIGIASFDLSMKSPKELVKKVTYALEKGTAAGGKVVVIGPRSQGAVAP